MNDRLVEKTSSLPISTFIIFKPVPVRFQPKRKCNVRVEFTWPEASKQIWRVSGQTVPIMDDGMLVVRFAKLFGPKTVVTFFRNA